MKRIRKNKHLNPTHGWSNGMRALPALLFLILNSSFFICSCSDDTLSGITDTSETTVSGTGVRFGVNNATRLTASGYTRTFDEGDLVGCVVCTLATATAGDGTTTYSYEMLANSKWAVDGTYNTLRPIDYWAVGSSGYLEKTSIGSNNDLLFDYDDSGNTIINYVDGLYDAGDGALYFFYYTPFVEPDETSTTTALDSVPRDTTFNYEYTQSTDDSGNITISRTGSATAGNYMMGPATDNSLTYSGASSLTAYDWQTFPLYVHRDQRTDAHSAASTWMTEQYIQGLYPGSSADVSLVFEPLTADLLVTAGEYLAWAALVPYESSGTESSSETSAASITLGKQADLKTGDLSEWTQTDAGAATTTDTIWGHADGTNWLFHLAPQDDFSARLLFKYRDSETLDDGYARYMDLTDFTGTSGTTTGVLTAGAQYDVTVPSRYETATHWLYFTSTSSDGERQDDGNVFTSGVTGYAAAANNSVTLPYAAESSYIYEYEGKIESKAYIEINVEYAGMTLTAFFDNANNNGESSSAAYYYINDSYTISDGTYTINSTSSTNRHAVELTGYDSSGNVVDFEVSSNTTTNTEFVYAIGTYTFSTAGKYLFYRRSGSTRLLLLVLSNDASVNSSCIP